MTYEKKRIEIALQEIYKAYPKKLGKSPGIRTGLRVIKTDDDVRDLSSAVRNYRKFLKDNCVDPKFTLYFSTFMNQWRDWIDDDNGKTERVSDFSKSQKIDYNDMAREIWHWMSGNGHLTDSMQRAVDKIGLENLKKTHRDDFRPHGAVPGLIKKALENAT